MSWQRSEAGGPIEVLVGGDTLVSQLDDEASPPSARRSRRSVNLPPGAQGIAESAIDTRRRWGGLSSWIRVEGIVDPLTVSPEDAIADPAMQRPSLEDAVMTAWPKPFGWIVAALPVALAAVQRESVDLSRGIPLLRSKAGNGEEHAIALERHEARYRELQQAELRGLWSVHLIVGADDAEGARRFAALLCGCVDLERLPYRLRPGVPVDDLDALLDTLGHSGSGSGGSPFRGSTDALAAIATPPRREVPGVRMSPRPSFDLTPETDGDVHLGTILDAGLRPAGPMSLARSTLNRHTFVCGATGSGKSQTVRGLLESLSEGPEPTPWLVIEPAKAEYRNMAGRLEGRATVTCIRPGTPDSIAAGLNPLEPEPGFPLQTHVDLTRALFLASFQSEEPFPQVLSAALTRCYEDLGWDLTLGEAKRADAHPSYPTLGDLQRVAREVVTAIGYGEEVARNVRGFVDIRLSSLRYGTPGRFFEGGHPLDIGALLAENVVVEIEDVGDDQDKAFLMGSVIVRLVEHLRMRAKASPQRHGELRHVTVIEEAHRLLRRTEGRGPAAHAVELFASLLAEIRAYGEGIVVAEQIPSKIIPDVLKNTAVKVVHRLPAQDDRDAVGATMNMTEAQSEYIVTVMPGSAAVSTDGMDYPALVRMDLGEDRENDTAVSGAAPLAARFSFACGPECRQRACTLREMRMAERLLDEDRRVALWAELVVLAHIIGLPAPAPGHALRAHLEPMDLRTRDCALAHAVEAAVASRSVGLSRHYSPAALTMHVASVLSGQLAGSPPPCADKDHWTWQAGPFRWNHVFAKLEQWRRAGESGAHPETDAWVALYGLSLQAPSVDVQIAMLNTMKARDAEHRRALVFGQVEPSSLEAAVGSTRGADEWGNAVRRKVAALVFHRDWRWTDHYLEAERPASAAVV